MQLLQLLLLLPGFIRLLGQEKGLQFKISTTQVIIYQHNLEWAAILQHGEQACYLAEFGKAAS